MKLIFASTVLSVATLLTACQTSNVSNTVTEQKIMKSADLQQVLTAYTWSYQPQGSIQPILLEFVGDRLVANAGCNTMSTSWQLQGQQVITGQSMSTAMGCSPEIMQYEGFAGQLIDNRKIPVYLDHSNPKIPVLTIAAKDGKKYQFIGSETSETKYKGQAETVFWEVAGQTKPCTGVAVQQCLQVREIKYSNAGLKTAVGDWQLFHGNIEGFKHNPDVRTVLRLKRFTLQNPAADQSKYAYVHDMTVEQELLK